MPPSRPLYCPVQPAEIRDDEAQQWEQYLAEANLWEHFLSFAPEALQWTYNVQ